MRKLINERVWVLSMLWAVLLVRSSFAATESNGSASYSSPSQGGQTGVASTDGEPVVVPQTAQVCTYSLDPSNRVHDWPAEFATFNVIAPDGCDWTVDNLNDWMAIKLYTNGTGAGIVRYSVFVNPDPIERTGFFTVNGQTFTVTQLAAPCGYSILP